MIASLTKKIMPLLLALSFISSGCAERYREASPGRTAEEIEEFLADIRANRSAVNGSNAQAAFDMSKDQSTVVYFSESSNSGKAAMGPIHTVVPLDFVELGIDTLPRDMEYIRVYFLENNTGTDRHYALMIDIKKTGEAQPKLYVFLNNDATSDVGSSVEDGLFEVTFPLTTNGNKFLVLQSDDLDDDAELMDVAQFQVVLASADCLADLADA